MAGIIERVGEGAVANKLHDVALIQAMLRVIKNSKGHPYLAHPYDGHCGMNTKQAIKAFQSEHATAEMPFKKAFAQSSSPMTPARPTPPTWTSGPQATACLATDVDPHGVVQPYGPTMVKLNNLLPQTHKDIRTVPGARLVYWPESAKAASDSSAAIEGNSDLNQDFRKKVAELIRTMFDRYKLVLSVTKSGARRTFEEQYQIVLTGGTGSTNAGPGESNHNFGQGTDIGFNGLKWMGSTGHPVVDDWWLNKLFAHHPSWCLELWNVRNAIALDQLGLFKSSKAGDHIHVQLYSDDNVSMVKSLAKLLDTVGTMSWRFHAGGYESKLGLGGAWRHVGKATAIWAQSGPMEPSWLPNGNAGVKAMRDALRNDFNVAEAKRDQWTPESK